MSIIDDIDDLAAKEREIRNLEGLIALVSSLSEEELAKAWPRIIAARRALAGNRSTRASLPCPDASPPEAPTLANLRGDFSAVPHRFRTIFSKI